MSFHQHYVNIEHYVEDEDWWCSDHCKNKGLSVFRCGKQKEDTWIECQSAASCLRNQWFHTSCVGNTTSSWYCSEVCRTSQNTEHKQAYAMSTLWRGLLYYVERDVERENDGLKNDNIVAP
ncbi:uncharacterized protein LOC132716715 [Ruditapes philippinarum]|uniref:uncharacterized protein LOC132716715 n=1 Tax=Ruditapes philippinarum TaxID=129788 RepID=UPI00295BC25A|nr:uncharacterized protein LOC132716715 [Ruditapes philippinarum]